jgi:phosphatidylglycerol---prolipoprotein diacylglyceryl transferase
VALRLGSTPNTTTLPRAWARPTVALQVSAVRCDALVDAEPQALGVTYWFDAASHGEPYAVAVRFTGHRLGVSGKQGPRDSFTLLETVEGVVPGSGRVAVTTRIFDIAPGEWLRGRETDHAGQPHNRHATHRAA